MEAVKFDFESRFRSGAGYHGFLEQYGSETDIAKWQRVFESVQLTDDQRSVLGSFKRELNVVCMAGAWCGDCVAQCPIWARFEEVTDKIRVRYVDRDADPELAQELKICGGSRVPQVVFLSEQFKPVGWYGDRTLTRYREMAEQLDGAACSTGLVTDKDTLMGVVQDWLNEFERVQLILRLSPSLRKIHGD